MDLDRSVLRAVFAYHVLREILAADGVEDPDEAVFLARREEAATLQEAGLLSAEGGLLPGFAEALDRATTEVPDRLSYREKMSLMALFADACLSDGHLDHTESRRIIQAAETLGLPGTSWLAHLGKSGAMGEVELPEPEGVEGHLEPIFDPGADTVTPADRVTVTPEDG